MKGLEDVKKLQQTYLTKKINTERNKFIINDYNIKPDLHCSNLARLRFVSYDPECYLNYGASAWKYFEKKDNRVTVKEHDYDYHVYSENDIDYILRQITERKLNIAPDYYSWIRIGFGLASKLGEAGRKPFQIISSYYSGKQKIEPDRPLFPAEHY